VGDVVSAIWMLMNTNNKVDGEVFNISSGQPQKIAEILDACIALSGQKIPVVQDAERLKSYDIPVIIGDSSKLCAYTGWQCRIPLRKSLETMWAHITSGLQTSR
jgi:GDP-4-dehydro-6-deoxy-D-mannose reductase